MSSNKSSKNNNQNEIRHSFDISERRDRIPRQNTGTTNTKPIDVNKMTGNKNK